MGLFTFSVAGGGFILIGAREALLASISDPNSTHTLDHSPPPNSLHPSTTRSQKPDSKTRQNPNFSSLSFLFMFILFSFAFLNSVVSLIDANNANDRVGSVLQLQVLAIALLFLLYSVLGLLVNLTNSFPLSSSLLGLVGVFAFTEEFLLFYLQRKVPSGVEDRYYDLMLLPIAVCVISTIFELQSPKSNLPKLTRGLGLILQGTWFLQMGLSFFTSWMTHDCHLNKVSRGNFSVMCKGPHESHRGRAIATLQFNCHLALIVLLFVGFYSTISWKYGVPVDTTRYRPLGAEMQSFENSAQFTLDSDDDADEEIKEDNVAMQKAIVVESGMNGYSSHH
ncbi:Transmembrane protein like [Senna tora]|uniref:Transmembrane protein like n=1 Tax=Senna tora TaxID=362788 RepID=A0A834TE08_9FABA|nr:Transmembrane protein like [Senna tora]